MFQRSARSNQIRRDDGFAMAGRQRMCSAEDEGDPDGNGDHPGRELLLMEQSRERVGLLRGLLRLSGGLQESKNAIYVQHACFTKPCRAVGGPWAVPRGRRMLCQIPAYSTPRR